MTDLSITKLLARRERRKVNNDLEEAEHHRRDVLAICAFLAADAGIPHWIMRKQFPADDGPAENPKKPKFFAGGRWSSSQKYYPYRELIVGWETYVAPGGGTVLHPLAVCATDGCLEKVSLIHAVRTGKVGRSRCRACFQRAADCVWGDPLNWAYRLLQAAARKRGDLTVLSFDEFAAVVRSKPPCHYCGAPIRWSRHRRGLDRKDNSKGYVVGNVVPCCRRCNTIKGARLSESEMLARMADIKSSVP